MAHHAKSEGVDYQGVISLRLDAMCLEEMDIQKKNIPPGRIYLPSYFGTTAAGDNNINSLFAYGGYEAMRAYTNRDLNFMIAHDHTEMVSAKQD